MVTKLFKEFIDSYPEDEPIFFEDCSKFFSDNKENVNRKDLYVYFYRFIKKDKLRKFSQGIYYKPSVGAFGERVLNPTKIIERKYLNSDGNIKGYYSGAYLFNAIGLTTQIPKNISIVTNECPNKNQYELKNLNVIIRKPKIEINNDNYLYLQLLDILINKDQVNVEVENKKDIIFDFINRNNLKMDRIFYYAKKTNCKQAIERMYDLV